MYMLFCYIYKGKNIAQFTVTIGRCVNSTSRNAFFLQAAPAEFCYALFGMQSGCFQFCLVYSKNTSVRLDMWQKFSCPRPLLMIFSKCDNVSQNVNIHMNISNCLENYYLVLGQS